MYMCLYAPNECAFVYKKRITGKKEERIELARIHEQRRIETVLVCRVFIFRVVEN